MVESPWLVISEVQGRRLGVSLCVHWLFVMGNGEEVRLSPSELDLDSSIYREKNWRKSAWRQAAEAQFIMKNGNVTVTGE